MRYDSQNIFNQIKSVEYTTFTSPEDLSQARRLLQESLYTALPQPPLYTDQELRMEFYCKGMP